MISGAVAQFSLAEVIEAKLQRRAELLQEVESIDRELEEAKLTLRSEVQRVVQVEAKVVTRACSECAGDFEVPASSHAKMCPSCRQMSRAVNAAKARAVRFGDAETR